MTDNVTEIFSQYDGVQAAYADLTFVIEDLQEKYSLSDHEIAMAVQYLSRYTQDYGYYQINGLMEEEPEED